MTKIYLSVYFGEERRWEGSGLGADINWVVPEGVLKLGYGGFSTREGHLVFILVRLVDIHVLFCKIFYKETDY